MDEEILEIIDEKVDNSDSEEKPTEFDLNDREMIGEILNSWSLFGI